MTLFLWDVNRTIVPALKTPSRGTPRFIFLFALTIILAGTLADTQESSGNASSDPEHHFASSHRAITPGLSAIRKLECSFVNFRVARQSGLGSRSTFLRTISRLGVLCALRQPTVEQKGLDDFVCGHNGIGVVWEIGDECRVHELL